MILNFSVSVAIESAQTCCEVFAQLWPRDTLLPLKEAVEFEAQVASDCKFVCSQLELLHSHRQQREACELLQLCRFKGRFASCRLVLSALVNNEQPLYFVRVEQQQLEKTDYVVEERKKLRSAYEESKAAKLALLQASHDSFATEEQEEIERPIDLAAVGSRDCAPSTPSTTAQQQQQQRTVPPPTPDVSDEFLKEQIRLQNALIERERELKRVALELVSKSVNVRANVVSLTHLIAFERHPTDRKNNANKR